MSFDLKQFKHLGKLGFEGRTFLIEQEWHTFCRNLPVRYIPKKKESKCFICGKSETSDNKFDNSHLIGFKIGIIYLGLTPEYVNSHANIVTAHRKSCNKKSEKKLAESMRILIKSGVKTLPDYLPSEIRDLWNQEKQNPQ